MKNHKHGIHTSASKRFDLVCLGRAAVDLYGEQIGSPLEDIKSFDKSLGGSAANVAVCAARQGLRVAMLTRVGNEQMGNFVVSALAREGIDVSQISRDEQRLTGLVLLSIRNQESFPLMFYRENCADMALDEEHILPDFLRTSRALLLTGTHLSKPSVFRASQKAAEAIRSASDPGNVILDIDYRPVLWGVARNREGEERYRTSAEVSRSIQEILPLCDVIVGTEEEIRIAGGEDEAIAALRSIRSLTRAAIVMKRGPKGASVFLGDIPTSISEALNIPGKQVQILNVLGAGDAFMGGLLRGLLEGKSWGDSIELGNLCGALVVSRHNCSEAMPYREEIDALLLRGAKSTASNISSNPSVSDDVEDETKRIDKDPWIQHLHRTLENKRDSAPRFLLAFDHRAQFRDLGSAFESENEDKAAGTKDRSLVDAVSKFKTALAEAAFETFDSLRVLGGIIADDEFGMGALNVATSRPDAFCARPIEVADAESFRLLGEPNVELYLRSWPRFQTIKCLLRDKELAPQCLERTLYTLRRLDGAAEKLHRTWMLEIVAEGEDCDSRVQRSMELILKNGIRPSFWKIAPFATEAAWNEADRILEAFDRNCLGFFLLGGGEPIETLIQKFQVAKQRSNVRGFAVGRSIFWDVGVRWLRDEWTMERTERTERREQERSEEERLHALERDVKREVRSRLTRLIEAWRAPL